MLGLKFAYATNGHDIIEIDYFTGTETRVTEYPKPGDVWQRYRNGNRITGQEIGERLLTPFNHELGKDERYYQQIAINRTVEAILQSWQSASSHDGDRHGQDVCGVPDLLEAVVGPLEPNRRVSLPTHCLSGRSQHSR
jgi:hypothetical protein